MNEDIYFSYAMAACLLVKRAVDLGLPRLPDAPIGNVRLWWAISMDVLRKMSGNKAEKIKDGTWMASVRKVIEALGPDGEIPEDVANGLTAISFGAGMVR